MLNIKETADTIKANVKSANQTVIKTSDKVVDETLAAGKDWTNIFAKAMKTGTTIFGQQQEVALNVIEGARDQFVAGNVRFRKLVGLENFDATKTAKKVVKTVRKEVAEVADIVVDKVMDVKNDVVKTAKKEVTTAKKTTAKVTKKVTKAAPKAKVTTPKVKVAAPKVKVATPKVKTVAKKVVVKNTNNDLKVIDGIGPKMQEVLAKMNISTFAQLAAFDAKALKELLVAENPRYAMYEPELWVAEAKKMMK